MKCVEKAPKPSSLMKTFVIALLIRFQSSLSLRKPEFVQDTLIVCFRIDLTFCLAGSKGLLPSVKVLHHRSADITDLLFDNSVGLRAFLP